MGNVLYCNQPNEGNASSALATTSNQIHEQRNKQPHSRCTLLIIDAQNDFHEGGSLAVQGANNDSARTAAMIKSHWQDIDQIYVTLDSHHRTHIAHAICWTNPAGESPSPFTLITHDDIVAGKWTMRNKSLHEHSLKYTKFLQEQGKFTLCIWPEHCLLGTRGHNIVDVINEALHFWIEKTGKEVHYVMKGENCLTEMYSAIKADYIIPEDPRTQTNPILKEELEDTDLLLVCGQALSHCVNSTFTDILSTYPDSQRRNLVLLTDACSSVGGFEANGAEFVARIQQKGCRTAETTSCFETLKSHSVRAAGAV